MKPTTLALLGMATALALAPGRALAQAWDSPSFLSPWATRDLGFYYVQPDEGYDWGAVAMWRTPASTVNLDLRGGLMHVDGLDRNDLLIGVGLSAPIATLGAATGLPLDLAWTAGAGAIFPADWTLLRVPVGVSMGLRIGRPGDDFRLLPYAHPRIALAVASARHGEGSSHTELQGTVDLGMDLIIGNDVAFRLGAALGDAGSVGFGLAFGLGRGPLR